MTTQERFFAFLKKHRAYRKFLKNFKKCDTHPGKTIEELICLYIKDEISDSLILGAFGWRQSPEGVSYWSNLSHEWRKICNTQEKK